ncbi:MAG: biotin--[acetyl-CoA-carboxylase] ligase [candidate division WOR-3 bacterium]
MSDRFRILKLPNFRIGHTIFSYLQLSSTQKKAKELVNNVANGTVVVSRIQTEGKGRGDDIWISEIGGLYFSIIYVTFSLNDQITNLTKTLAVGVKTAIEKVVSPLSAIDLEIKGINDLILSKKKLAGILVETESFVKFNAQMDKKPKVYILGIGINVNQISFPKHLKDIATSLLIETGYRISRLEILKSVCEELDKLLE